MTLCQMFDAGVAQHGAAPLTDFLGARLTYAQIGAKAAAFAATLVDWGLVKGDRIGLYLPNVPDYLIAYYGALKAGDATFHRGWTLHRAPPNPTPLLRSVMTIIWYADGTRVSQDVSGARYYDHILWLAETPSGNRAEGPLNPLLWPR